MKIFLIGLPGSGKTTLGKELAVLLGLPFIDLDAEIEREAGTTISRIFELHGEAKFRELESDVLRRWCDKPDGFVMATGGGAPSFKDNLDIINRSGISIFLDVPVEVITERIRRDGQLERPLLASLPPVQLNEKIEGLRNARISFYQKAQFIFSGNETTASQIVAAISPR
jgi:shikimate kinase